MSFVVKPKKPIKDMTPDERAEFIDLLVKGLGFPAPKAPDTMQEARIGKVINLAPLVNGFVVESIDYIPLGGTRLIEHLQGQHDQADHAGGRGGGVEDKPASGPRERKAKVWTDHPEKGSVGTGTQADPIRTRDLGVAVKSIGEGKWVSLASEDQVATLLDELHAVVKDFEAKGEKAPTYDLCKVTVPGTNVFCVESKGIPRIQMPQFKGVPTEGSPAAGMEADVRGEVDTTTGFLEKLKADGVTMEEGTAPASHLKATQSELNGAKVAGIMQAARGGKLDMSSPLVVSADGYIVDGHHRWAATVALELDGIANPTTDIPIPVVRVNMDILDILREANDYTIAQGIPQAGVAAPMPKEKP